MAAGLLLTWPATATAQQTPLPRKEGPGVAILYTAQLGGGKMLGLRVTAPANEHVAFDFDIGLRLGKPSLPPPLPPERRAGRPAIYTWKIGAVAGAHVRWLPKGRSETGWSAALSSGIRFIRATGYDFDVNPTRRWWRVVPDAVGLTIDRLTEGGYRVGAEVGGLTSFVRPPGNQSIGTIPLLYAGLFGGWTKQ